VKNLTNLIMQNNLALCLENIKNFNLNSSDALEQDDNKILQRNWAFNFYIESKVFEYAKWLEASDESSNYTYDLRNYHHLYGWIDAVTSCGLDVAKKYINEITSDLELASYIQAAEIESKSKDLFTKYPGRLYGRRIGWYAITRIKKPKFLVETGVDRGLGSVLLCRALMRNTLEGYPGKYLGTDINPSAGYLLQGNLRQFGEIKYGDSIQTLRTIKDSVDMFINDSDHSAEYEENEYETIKEKLSIAPIVLGDNSHVTSKLYEFAERQNMSFLHYAEQPAAHWYPGAGIGAAFKTI
jgi:hypothetical protein